MPLYLRTICYIHSGFTSATMTENIISKIALAAVIGGALGLFYSLLLNLHGFSKIKYKHAALSVGLIIFLLSLYKFEAAGIGAFILGIGVFILAIALFVRGTADSLKDMVSRFSLRNNVRQGSATTAFQENNITSYFGVLFHFVVIVLICLSIFTYSKDVILDQEHIDRLVADAAFQFSSTILLMLLGLFNPFVTPSEKLMRFSTLIDQQKYPKWHALMAKKSSWTIIKSLICIGILSYFINTGFFNIPSWNTNSPFLNGYILIIGLFIFINLMQLIRNPDLFFKRNYFRITMLFRSVHLSLFVGAILVFSTLFISAILGIDTNRLKVSSEAILLLGFNIVMCYNEYRLVRA